MGKKINILFFLIALSVFCNNFDINHIEKLNPVERSEIIYKIGEERDLKNIQILINFLKDDEKILWRNPETPWGFTVTTPGWEAAKGILKIGKEAVPFLIDFIVKKEKGYEKAIWILGELKSDEVVPLILKIKPSSGDLQLISIIVLGKIKDESSLPYLISSLENYWNRIYAVEAIENFGKKAIPYLINAIENKETKSIVKAYCCILISKIKEKENVEEKISLDNFLKLLNDSDVQVRRKVSEAIINLNTREYNKELINIIKKENDWIVRSNLIEAIGKSKDKECAEQLIKFLDEKDITIKIKVCEAIGEIGDKEKGKDILRVIKESDYWYLKKVAIETIGKIKDENSYRKIIETVREEKDLRVIASILFAGGEIGKEEFSDFIIPYISFKNSTVMKVSYNALIKIGEKSLPYIIKYVNENIEKLNWETINLIRDLLSEIGKEKIEKLIEFLGNPNWKIQVLGVNLLTKIGEKALPFLHQAIENKMGSIKYRAIQTIGNIQNEKSIEPLINLIVEEKDINIKKEAINSLGKIKNKKSVEFLIDLLKEEGLKEFVLNTIEKMTNKFFGYDIEKWKEYIEKEWK
ncbi:MAG: HEAT repeat domain-containing protein [Candidatus Omnitrophica bacterium]|nr:HEAT repeat domain-containing protein [Candidatus Omnitrophota bacterium]MCM8803290.1 HEAT repeat domain-containing protein [Candidatus Omnitrophota bacterium]